MLRFLFNVFLLASGVVGIMSESWLQKLLRDAVETYSGRSARSFYDEKTDSQQSIR
jgi:phosphoribulokinase